MLLTVQLSVCEYKTYTEKKNKPVASPSLAAEGQLAVRLWKFGRLHIRRTNRPSRVAL